MKHYLYYMALILSMISCTSHKNMSYIIYDEGAEKYQQALQRKKAEFFVSDSAYIVAHDLGWVRRIVSDAKISDNSTPLVYKNINETGFTIELPCWDVDTDTYRSAVVVTEHSRLDSALIKAKIEGVDNIFLRSNCYIKTSSTDIGEYKTDSIEYYDSYTDYIRNARFSCVCITKGKKTYIVNATIHIPIKLDILDIETRKALFQQKMDEYIDRFKKNSGN